MERAAASDMIDRDIWIARPEKLIGLSGCVELVQNTEPEGCVFVHELLLLTNETATWGSDRAAASVPLCSLRNRRD